MTDVICPIRLISTNSQTDVCLGNSQGLENVGLTFLYEDVTNSGAPGMLAIQDGDEDFKRIRFVNDGQNEIVFEEEEKSKLFGKKETERRVKEIRLRRDMVNKL